jgi:hypothetical protein
LIRSYKLRFHDVHVRAVPARDEAGCPFAGPGIDLRSADAKAILDSPELVGSFRAWLEAREPGVVLRSLSVDLESRRVLVTLEPTELEQRPRVVRIDPPHSEELIAAAEPLKVALVDACNKALRRRAERGRL